MPLNPIIGADGGQQLQGSADADLIYGFNPNGAQGNVNNIAAIRIATGFDQPLFVGSPPEDPHRLFVVEKTGRIKIIDISRADLGVTDVKATPFLDLSNEVSTTGESGLLGLAFDPNFASNGAFYVNLINLQGDTEIRRYQVSAADPDRADPASAETVVSIDQPSATNHKAGWLGFGPDGLLYAALGDGGADSTTSQNIDSLLGKILRLDVSPDQFPADPSRNYTIPSDNPFAAGAGADEIFALGLRNPFRNSFDRATGDFYIADVGQNAWEEINVGQLGANYGWNRFEGPAVFTSGSSSAGLTFPIHSYDHTVGSAVIGGYVYRGSSDFLHGQLFYGDEVNSVLATLRFVNGQWISTDRIAQLNFSAGGLSNLASFGEDARGNLYVVDIADGEVFRLDPTGNSLDGADAIRAGSGNDQVFAGAGNDQVFGEAGDDALYGMDGDDGLDGGAGNDHIFGGAGADTLRGGAGNDFLDAAAGGDWLFGDVGADTMVGGSGDDILDGGSDDDAAIFSQNLNAYELRDLGARIEVSGADGNDTLFSTELLRFADGAVNVNDGNTLFDTIFYDRNYLDVFHAGANAADHYDTSGWREGRDPNASFSTSGYLSANKDVAATGVNPLQHYHQYGWREDRDSSAHFDTTLYLLKNPDVTTAVVDPLEHYLQFGHAEGRSAYAAIGQTIVAGFDAEFYLLGNPDVGAAGVDPLLHFNMHGWREGRNPNAFFSTSGYFARNPDVAAAAMNPLDHYEQHGWHEGRDPSQAFDTLSYLSANPDVAAAHINPLNHFLQFGVYEGRTAFDAI